MRAATFAFVLASLASAQPSDANKTARVEGSVRSSVTGEPLQYVIVTLGNPITRAAGATDREGKFVIEDIAPASGYQLTSARAGYAGAAYGSRVPGGRGTPFTLSAGQVLKDLVIMMVPQGVISGRITNSEGVPVPGAIVVALRSILGATGREFIAKGSERTDEQGDYRMTDVAPGLYYVSASLQGAIRSELVTYYPNAPDLSGATSIPIAAGAEVARIDIRLRSTRTYTLRGKAVIAATGAPAGGFTITSQRIEKNSSLNYLSRIQTLTRTDGAFEFTGLLPGPHTLEIASTRIATPPIAVSGRTEVTISNGDADDVQVLLRTGVTVSGTVRLEEGDIKSLIPPASANRLDTAQDLNAYIQAAVNSPAGTPAQKVRPSINLGNPRYGLFQEDGTFTKIVDLSPSRYYLNVTALPDGVYVKAASLNGVDALHAPLDLTNGGGELNVVLSNKAADITGSLRNEKGEPLGNVAVTLWLSNAELGAATSGIRYTASGQNGTFRFRNLPPGQYHLAAWEDVDERLLLSREFLSRFTSAATEVKLAESQHAELNPKMIPAETVAAEVAKLP